MDDVLLLDRKSVGSSVSSAVSVDGEDDFDQKSSVQAASCAVILPTSTASYTALTPSPSDTFTDYISLISPAYQSEVVIPADGSPVALGSPPAVDASPVGRSTGLSHAGLWDSVSRNAFATPTKHRTNPLTTFAEMVNWDSVSTTATTTTAARPPLVNSSSSSSRDGAVGSAPVNNINSSRDNAMFISPGVIQPTTAVSSDTKLSVSTTVENAAVQSKITCSAGTNCHLPSSSGTVSSHHGAAGQPSQLPTRRVRSLWDGGWLVAAEQGEKPGGPPTSTELSGGGGKRSHQPVCGNLPRLPPLRLVLIKTADTGNIWSSKPAAVVAADNSSARAADGDRPTAAVVSRRPTTARDICGSVSESALSDFTRWTRLNSARSLGRDRLKHLPLGYMFNAVLRLLFFIDIFLSFCAISVERVFGFFCRFLTISFPFLPPSRR